MPVAFGTNLPGLGDVLVPDDVVFVDEIPLTATGKISKIELRERFQDHLLRFE